MTLFTLRSLRKDFGIKEILKDASFSLDEGDKVGLIGTNGSGKSTLLKMIAGLESFDGGDLWVNSSAKIIYLPQQPDLNEEFTVLEQVFADSGEQMALVKAYEEISDKLSHGHGDQDLLLSQLSSVSERMDQTGAWDLETNAKIILTKLGIHDLEAKIGSLSGGYRKRIAIATALLATPDVLLMDEPTNHLDALSVEWLQSYLNRYRGALLIITHDRYFLDKVTNRIIEIDRGDLYAYSGNYSYYLEKKAEAEESAVSTQRKHAGLLRRELEWLKKGPKARSTKQKARIDRAHALQNKEFKQVNAKVDITTAGRRIGKKVVELDRVAKSFGDRTLIKDFSYNFTPDDRIGIIGRNGAGKSTLMNMITGRLQPDAGTVEIGTTIHFGYFDQHSDDLLEHGSQRVIDYLKDVAELVKTNDGSIITASQMLERFLFSPNQQYAPINKLSGGERRRLFLLKVLMAAPNVLILDEPTNDLDVQTLSVLEEYLEDFNGCVIVVSHDRYFLDRTVDMVFSFESEGEVRLYPGNYTVYLEYKKEEVESETKEQSTKIVPVIAEAIEPSKPKPEAKKSQKSQLSYKEKREYEELETKIPKLEDEKAQIERTIYHNPPSSHIELQKLADRLAELTAAINQATDRWLELAERI
ncbi:ABC-F family ATP-binding cassette domain-containing protein [Pseudanabaena sp. FACHB-1277]|uniref:ABC-F family ATP-binding cassette domain-containing protein n=1 Tax=Pseudanabaena cinerea FACHB-1277 TaxID=2949581 RepID=A0A926UZ10_9CYAN|nr:ABC-F family ATP-binding cassette domain-containing protein [Pseudanabaena cinerea]MBD2152755.1 ABC-F family ATP-binding cassette domain-containing protein [Pseudanabaena cinerea FACHB-1277]